MTEDNGNRQKDSVDLLAMAMRKVFEECMDSTRDEVRKDIKVVEQKVDVLDKKVDAVKQKADAIQEKLESWDDVHDAVLDSIKSHEGDRSGGGSGASSRYPMAAKPSG